MICRMESLRRKFIYILGSFVAGFSVMTVELTSTRIVAPLIGNSLFTWTSVIGVTLLGLSIGSLIGGKVADKQTDKPLLSWFFLISSVLVFVTPILVKFSDFVLNLSNSVLWLNLLMSVYLFILPAVAIGTIQPIILKKYADSFSSIGREYGILSSVWSVGSILGVFLTGFLFISSIGSSGTLYAISLILFLTAIVFYMKFLSENSEKKFFENKILISVFIIFIFLAVFWIIFADNKNNNPQIIFSTETNYYNLKVADIFLPGFGQSRILQLDFDTHSIDTKETNEDFYPEIYPVFSYLKNDIKNILVIGAGAYTMPEYFKNYYADANVSVIETDPEMISVGQKYFGLDTGRISTEIGDARLIFNKEKAGPKYDVIFSDAYNSFVSVPWYLLTEEWNETAKKELTPDGIYAVNFISGLEGDKADFTKSVTATFAKTFPNYYVFAFGDSPNGVYNVTLVGVNGSLPLTEADLRKKLSGGVNPFLADKLLSSSNFLARADSKNSPPVILTDDFAPVEKLMSPIIEYYFPENLAFVGSYGLNK